MENKKGGDLICKRPESIIEARYKLTKRQNDVLDIVFASIKNDNKLKYEIDIAQYSQLYNIEDKSNIYRDFKKAAKSFEGKGFSITHKINPKKENRIYFSWFSSITYMDGESRIVVELGQTLKELMLKAKKACFYQIKYPINFRNIYSKRIYYYLKSFEDTGWRIDNLDILRYKLECPKTYERYADFKRFVLKPAYEEINENSDIKFEFEEIKTKAKVTGIKSFIYKKSIKKELETLETDTIVYKPIEELTKNNKILEIVKEMFSDYVDEKNFIKIVQATNKAVFEYSTENVREFFQQKKEFINEYAKKNKINSYIALLLKGIQENWETGKEYSNQDQQASNFNDYEQRNYNFNVLERRLLGWDKEDAEKTNLYIK